LTDLIPIDFSTEPGSPQEVVEGATLTAELPLRGNIQIRVEEVTDRQITFATIEGHPLAGVVRFISEPRGEAVRFTIETLTRAANVLDMLAMNTVGGRMQDSNWEQVVERAVALSEGEAPAGVESDSVTVDEESAREIEHWIEELVANRKRKAVAQKTGE
jgi:NADH dehydrogenase